MPRLDDWVPQSWLERSAKPLFAGRTWPEPRRDPSQDIDMELSLDAGIMDYAERLVRLYERLTPPQRAVVGRYLDLHLMHVGEWYDQPGQALLKQNRDTWLAGN